MKIILCCIIAFNILGSKCSLYSHQSEIKAKNNCQITFEAKIEKIAPDPGYVSGVTLVYRLVKYHISHICAGQYEKEDLVADHLILKGHELDNFKVDDIVYVTVTPQKDISSRWNVEGIREPNEVVNVYYIVDTISFAKSSCQNASP